MNSTLIDLQEYTIKDTAASQCRLYPIIPRSTRAVPFDIYDYNYLFQDEKTLGIIRRGDTIGCFYIESPGMRSLLRRLDVSTFEMLVAASSVIRPGVAESGMMQEFIVRHKNPLRRKYLVPEMERVLGETYGVMIYQEDVIKVAHKIVGMTLEEADLLRRAMSGKMRSSKAMEYISDRFYECSQNKKLTRQIAEELWRQISSFAGYAFCKAHSASFALLSFQLAFLKAHYPAEFMAGVLSNRGGYYSPAVYIQEAKRLGIEIKLPCINESKYAYFGLNNTIRIGLMAIKNLSKRSCEKIIGERKCNGRYHSLADFMVRTKISYEETAKLIECGAMDCLKETRCTLFRLVDIYFNKLRMLDESYNDLFINESFELEKFAKTNVDFSVEQKCIAEYESFNYMVTRHPLEIFDEILPKPDIIRSCDLNKYHGKRVKMVGWFMASKRIKTKKGDIMKFLSLEDLTGTFEAVIFPKVYSEVAMNTISMGPFIIEGKADIEGGNNIIVEKLELVTKLFPKSKLLMDSSGYTYMPDDEGFTEEEINLAKSLNDEVLALAYTG